MLLGIVGGRTQVDSGVAAGTLPGFLAALGSWRRLVLIRIPFTWLALGGAPQAQTQTQRQQGNPSQHRSIVTPTANPVVGHWPLVVGKIHCALANDQAKDQRRFSGTKKLLHGVRGAAGSESNPRKRNFTWTAEPWEPALQAVPESRRPSWS